MVTANTMYVVVRIGSEYNDEIMELNRGGDDLEAIYGSREAAETAQANLTVEFVKKLGQDLSTYTYDLNPAEVPDFDSFSNEEVMNYLDGHNLKFFRIETAPFHG